MKPTAFDLHKHGDRACGAQLVAACIALFGAPVRTRYGGKRQMRLDFASRLGYARYRAESDGPRGWCYTMRVLPALQVDEAEWTSMRLALWPTER